MTRDGLHKTTATMFSPSGTTNRRDYLSIFLVWFFGTVFITMVAGDLRPAGQLDLFYLAVALATTVLAWLLLCATIKRLRDLKWAWLLVLPWVPVSFWPLSAVFGIPMATVIVWPSGAYCVVTLGFFLFYQRTSEFAHTAARTGAHATETRVNSPRSTTPPAVALPVPLLGWLVAVDGAKKGSEFRLQSTLAEDRSPSSSAIFAVTGQQGPAEYAMICYAPETNLYSISPISDPLYLNDQLVTEVRSLTAYDRVRVQNSSFIFVPLYGEHSRWVDQPAERDVKRA